MERKHGKHWANLFGSLLTILGTIFLFTTVWAFIDEYSTGPMITTRINLYLYAGMISLQGLVLGCVTLYKYGFLKREMKEYPRWEKSGR